jgi:hypothetical protein
VARSALASGVLARADAVVRCRGKCAAATWPAAT